jgi:hypothetical protein
MNTTFYVETETAAEIALTVQWGIEPGEEGSYWSPSYPAIPFVVAITTPEGTPVEETPEVYLAAQRAMIDAFENDCDYDDYDYDDE